MRPLRLRNRRYMPCLPRDSIGREDFGEVAGTVVSCECYTACSLQVAFEASAFACVSQPVVKPACELERGRGMVRFWERRPAVGAGPLGCGGASRAGPYTARRWDLPPAGGAHGLSEGGWRARTREPCRGHRVVGWGEICLALKEPSFGHLVFH